MHGQVRQATRCLYRQGDDERCVSPSCFNPHQPSLTAASHLLPAKFAGVEDILQSCAISEEHRLWRQCFYGPVELMRKAVAACDTGKLDPSRRQPLTEALLEFQQRAISFYGEVLENYRCCAGAEWFDEALPREESDDSLVTVKPTAESPLEEGQLRVSVRRLADHF